MEDTIDGSVGIVLHVRPGDLVEIGQPIADIHARDEQAASTVQELLGAVIHVVPEVPTGGLPLISHRITEQRDGMTTSKLAARQNDCR